ncbi:Carbonic anhydrase or acetyltransferase, isoleucine patch superfamily [Malonomonas rubra DSM 5091]|uniref:Carbonic anhydrase or acetyltransferase, isoleucine patch superfamily n=1 Tax=Malonomonas rubra DSM 5091 TaxID=1122189 RepID=A0A1M6B800_MALRU|nr:gamma carbonic anhydrase family protein [Malonomonas rubra]SHI44852.1 Carbonic anhydrase or acetyltransferase, isoleucine patch superfamily [Malonomonas rubra DSM 5091]
MLHPFKGITPQLGNDVFLVDSAEVIGDVHIGEQSSLWFNVVVRGDVNFIRIGKRSNIQDGSVVHVTHKKNPTWVGDDVTVGHNVTLHGCRIGDRCLIGMGAVIMDAAVVEDDAMVAAGALVTPGTLVRSGTLFAGSPARFKRELTAEEIAGLKQSAENYLNYVAAYR